MTTPARVRCAIGAELNHPAPAEPRKWVRTGLDPQRLQKRVRKSCHPCSAGETLGNGGSPMADPRRTRGNPGVPMFASLISWNPPQQTRGLALLLEPHAVEDGVKGFVVFCVGGLGSHTDEGNQPLGA